MASAAVSRSLRLHKNSTAVRSGTEKMVRMVATARIDKFLLLTKSSQHVPPSMVRFLLLAYNLSWSLVSSYESRVSQDDKL
jgi:hypothetical protein